MGHLTFSIPAMFSLRQAFLYARNGDFTCTETFLWFLKSTLFKLYIENVRTVG